GSHQAAVYAGIEDASRVRQQRHKPGPGVGELRIFVAVAEADGERDDPAMDRHLAAGGRTPQIEIGADLERDGDRGEQQVDAARHADADADRHLEMEWLPLDQHVGMGDQPGAQVAVLEHDGEHRAGHRAGRRQGEIGFARDGDVVAHLPAIAEPRHLRVVRRRPERGVIAAEREHEVALVVTGVPHVKGETTGQPARRIDHVGARAEEAPDAHRALGRIDLRLGVELREHVGTRRRRRQLHHRTAEQAELEVVAELAHEQRMGLDQAERGEFQPRAAQYAPACMVSHGAWPASDASILSITAIGVAPVPPAAPGSAKPAISGKSCSSSTDGSRRSVLRPKPPSRPVTKKYGGPPMGARSSAKRNIDVSPPVRPYMPMPERLYFSISSTTPPAYSNSTGGWTATFSKNPASSKAPRWTASCRPSRCTSGRNSSSGEPMARPRRSSSTMAVASPASSRNENTRSR